MDTRILRSCMICLLGLFLLFSFLPSQSLAQEKEPIKIGVVLTFSGVYAHLGKEMFGGCEMYLEKVGNKMGGRKIELLPEDSEGVPATALIKVKRLRELNKIHLMIGLTPANEVYAVLPYIESQKLPTILTGTADDVSQRKRGKYVLRGTFGNSQGTHPLGEYAYKVLGYRKIAAIVPDYAFGWETMGGFQRTFEELGGKITQKYWYPLTTNDFSPYLTQISKDSDAVFTTTAGRIAVVFAQQYREYGLKDKIPLVGNGTSTDEVVLPQMGDNVLGWITTLNYTTALDTAVNKEYMKRYKAKFNKSSSGVAEVGYTIMELIDNTLASLKGDLSDPDKFTAALKSIKFDSVRGPLKSDSYGGVDQNFYIRKVEKVGGEYQNTVIHTYPSVSQFWKYDPEEFMKQSAYTRDYSPPKR